MQRPPSTFQTRDLRLRPAAASDAEALFQGYARDPEVLRYLIWTAHPDLAATRAFLRSCEGAWAKGVAFPFALTLAGEDRLIGMIEWRPQATAASLGYVLARPYWGRGLMAQAVDTLAAWSLDPGGLHRVTATCDVDNCGSTRVLEKAGFLCEGRLARHTVHPALGPEPRDVWLYARARGERLAQ